MKRKHQEALMELCGWLLMVIIWLILLHVSGFGSVLKRIGAMAR